MKKSDFYGWKEVFSFSFIQGFKAKSYIIFLIGLFVTTLLAAPVMTFINQSKDSENPSEIERLMIYDTTGLPISYDDFTLTDGYAQVKIVSAGSEKAAYDAFAETLKDAAADVALLISFSEMGSFELNFVKPASLKEDDVNGLTAQFADLFAEAKLTAIDVTKEQYEFTERPVEIECKTLDSDGKIVDYREDEGISLEQYSILLGGIVVVTLIISFSGSSISTSIVTEKSTRVIEYLMINVRPMALLTGKILGCLSLTLIQFAVAGIGFLGSKIISAALFGAQESDSESIIEFVTKLSPVNVALALAVVTVGILFYSIIAGVAGASASKMEEMQEGMKLYTFSMIIGAYLGMFLCIMQLSGNVNPVMLNICSLIPISTPFIVPANLLTGNIGIGTACAGLAVLTVSMTLLFLFAARVYEALIFHNGKVLKLKDIMGIAKARKVPAQEGGRDK